MTSSDRTRYLELLEWMTGRTRLGMRPGLETTRDLLAKLGNPQDGLRAVQVAGTNGKGSTSRFLQGLLSSQGWKVGLFTSPHLVCVRERFLIGDVAIPESVCADLLERIRPVAEEVGATFFEICTVLAVLWFVEENVDFAVLETGLGGRLDSVTALPVEALLLTGVSLDHMALLGDTVEAIWNEKIAAARPQTPIFAIRQSGQLDAILETHATALGCDVVWCDQAAPVHPGLDGEHQSRNLALAWRAAVNLLGRAPNIVKAQLQLDTLMWPGRWQWLEGSPRILLDVGHNPQAMELLARKLVGTDAVVLFGCMADKDWRTALSMLMPVSSSVHLMPLATARAASPEQLAAVFSQATPYHEAKDAVSQALADASKKGTFLVITGSFHTVGTALRELHALGRGNFWPEGIVPDPEVPGLG
jgi:dihydrofolate synthase / folylpolyglutamate synthase